MDRTSSLIIAIIGNVLDANLKSECDNLIVGHEFQEPFGDDIADDLNNVIRAVDAGIMSEETGIEMNPLVKDPHREAERIKKESEERLKTQQSIFGNTDGSEGAQNFGDE